MRLALIALVLLLAVTLSHEIVWKPGGGKPPKPPKPPTPPKPPMPKPVPRPVPKPPSGGGGGGSVLPGPGPKPVPGPAPIHWTTRRTTPRPKVCSTDTECAARQFCRDQRCRRGPTGTGVSCSASVIPSTCGVNRTCVDYECSCHLDNHCRSSESCDGKVCRQRTSDSNTGLITIGSLVALAVLCAIVVIYKKTSC